MDYEIQSHVGRSNRSVLDAHQSVSGKHAWVHRFLCLSSRSGPLPGPVFHYSDTWQLMINTITNVVAFVMVFLIQRAQNEDTLAMQIKLSELLATTKGKR
jgi:low affinity Fe/Cu permease